MLEARKERQARQLMTSWADSSAFILRAVGSFKARRTQKNASGCRREGARGSRTLLGGHGSGPGRVRMLWARAAGRAGFQVSFLLTPSRAPLCSEQLPSSGQRPSNLGQHRKDFANTQPCREEEG